MSITEQHTQEQLSRAYVLAVVAEAGLNIGIAKQYDYGVDIEVNRIDNAISMTGEVIHNEEQALKIQLKATKLCKNHADHISYRCAAGAYNKMIAANEKSQIPTILVVFCQPANRADWLTVSEDGLTLRTACYWYYPTGAQVKSAKTIRIPRTQLFSPVELKGIIERVKNGVKP